MDIQQMRIFLSVVETGSFTRAAELCNITQPAVSHQIKRAEKEMGQPLLERDKRQVRLTYAGEILVGYIRRILSLSEEATSALKEQASGETGKITLAAIGTSAAYVLPDVLYQFRTHHPGIQIILRTWGGEDVETFVENGQADLGIVGSHISTEGFTAIPLFTDTVIPVVYPGHTYAVTGEAYLADLVREPLILFGGPKNWNDYVLGMFQSRGLTPQTDMQVDSIEAVKRMVARGLGFTVVPAIAAERELMSGELVALRLIDAPPLERQIMLIHRKGHRLSTAARLLVEDLQAMGNKRQQGRIKVNSTPLQ